MKPQLWTDSLIRVREVPKETLAMADAYVQGDIIHTDHYEMEKCRLPVHFEKEIPWEVPFNGDMEWVFALSRHTMLRALATACAVTGNKTYAFTCFSIWNDFLVRQPHTPSHEATTWRSLEAGLRMEQWMRTLELFGLAGISVPEELARNIETSIDEHASYLLSVHTPFHRLSNWGVIQDHGLLLAGIWRGKRVWFDEAVRRLCEEAELQVLPDGVDWEQSPLYHAEVLRCLLDAVLVTRHAGYPLPSVIGETAYRMAKALSVMTFGDSMLFPQGDSDVLSVKDLRTEAAILFDDASLFCGFTDETFLDFHERELKPQKAIAATACSVYLAESGCCRMRKNDLELFFHAGPLGSGHGHLDAGNIDIAFKGNLVFVDSGRFTYTPTPIREHLKNPTAHNVLSTFADARSSGSWSYHALLQPVGMRVAFHEACDCAECWIRHPDGTLTRRRVMLFAQFLVVFDDVFGHSDSLLSWHLSPEVSVKELGSTCQCGPLALTLMGKGTQSIIPEETSQEYNMLRTNSVITHSVGPEGHIISVASTIPLQAEETTLSFLGDGSPLSAEYGYGVKLTMGTGTVDIINRRQECIHQVDLLHTGELSGYGSLLYRQNGHNRVVFTT